MVINTIYDPISQVEFNKTKMRFNGQKAFGIIPAGQEANVDLAITDDHLLTGVVFNVIGNAPGDEITLQIVHPTNGVILTFLNWFARSFDRELGYPAKIPAGLIIRAHYKSIGTKDVEVYCNYFLHKILV